MTRATRAGLLLALAALMWAPSTSAQEAVRGEALQVHATFFNVGVMLSVSGDTDGDASAALEVGVGGGEFRAAHRLSRSGPDRFVGSAFGLPADTPYRVRVTLQDPDGAAEAVWTAEGRTRSAEVPTSDGGTLHVDGAAPAGGDGSAAAPLQTVAAGMAAAQPGDTVLVHAGVYHEEVRPPRGGAPGAPITLRAAGDGPAVMDGADPALLDPAAWTEEGDGLYSAPVAGTRYVAVAGVRLWRYESRADLQALSLGTDGGFHFEAGRVYVRLPGGAAPSRERPVQVSTLGRALWLAGTPHVVISGLTIRCYGAETYSEGVMVRDGSHGVWIVGNTFENVMPGVWVKGAVDDLVVMDNHFSDRGLAEFPWHAVKAQGNMESGAIAVDAVYDGEGIVFFRNVVQGSFDGLNICGNQPMAQPNNADVVDNLIVHVSDDGIDTDRQCSNIRIVGNRFEELLVAVSAAPAVGGPTYVLRNQMLDLLNLAPDSQWSVRALKFNVSDERPSGEVFVYHNTAVTFEAEQAVFTVTDHSRWAAVHLLNNIWVGTRDAFAYNNSRNPPLTHDYDLLHGAEGRLVSFQNERYSSPQAYFDATGHCEHCLAGPPGWIDGAPGGDFSLGGNSPALDRGVLIPGINDDYLGAGPDMGALELGAPQPERPDLGATGEADGGEPGELDGGAAGDTDESVDAREGPDSGSGEGDPTGGATRTEGCACDAPPAVVARPRPPAVGALLDALGWCRQR